MARDVFITGIGTVSALGVGVQPLWEGMCAGRSALGPLTLLDPSGFLSKLGGEVKGFAAKDYVPKSYRKAVKVMARDIELAVGAAKVAVDDAGLVTRAHADTPDRSPSYEPSRMGCHIGAGLISAETLELAAAQATAVSDDPADASAGGFSLRNWGTVSTPAFTPKGGMDNLPPLWMLKYLPNMLACHVTIIHGCEGPSNTITCAEASSLLSLGESRRVIERGDADVCFSGGAESKPSLMGLMRAEFTGRLAPTGDATDGGAIVRPFDPDAPGTLLAEGGGILILEAEPAARARGARAYAKLSGFGAAQSPTGYLPVGQEVPEAEDQALQLAVEAALRDADLTPGDIDAIASHALGWADHDAAELRALSAVFGTRLRDIEVLTTAPYVGDMGAGHGAVQVAAAALAVFHQTLPARLNTGRPPAGIRAAPAPMRPATLRHVLIVSASIGGQNSAAILSRIA